MEIGVQRILSDFGGAFTLISFCAFSVSCLFPFLQSSLDIKGINLSPF